MSNALPRLIRAGLAAALFVLLIAAPSAPAATDAWFARVWQSDDGLPDNDISGVGQTSDGYLWVATVGGLMRFDGARFQAFSPVNLEGVPGRAVRTLLRDRRDRLWLGMVHGSVVCVEPYIARVFTVKDGLPDLEPVIMAEDSDGAIWIAHGGGGLSRIKDGQVTRFGATDGLPASGVGWLASDVKGQLWFASGRQVGVFREGKFLTLLNLGDPATRLAKARAGGVWISTGQRLLKYDEGGTSQEPGRLPPDVEPTVLLEDRAGALWMGTAANGLYRYDGSRFENVHTSHSQISCLAEDWEGNIWAGTVGGGLNRLRPRTVELLGREAGLPFESLRSVCEDATAAIWVVTQNGLLARKQGAAWDTVTAGRNWPGGHVTCVTADRSGTVWIGTQDRGLLRFQDGRFTVLEKREGSASDPVRSLLASSTGDLWIVTESPNQLQRLRAGALRNLALPPSVGSVRAMAEDPDGNIWVGTSEGQLFQITGDTVANETAKLPARPPPIRCLCATPDASLWIGYDNGGLARLKAGRHTRITTTQGLDSDSISQIVADERGGTNWLWFAGNHGFFQVLQNDLVAVAEGRDNRLRSIVYGRDEGVPSLQASYESFPGAGRGRDGRVWICTRTGLAVIDGKNIRDNPVPPPVLVERAVVDGQTVALYGSRSPLHEQGSERLVDLRAPDITLRLRPDFRKLEVDFAALSFTAPENVHFQYRLEGFDEGWIEAGTQRSAGYSRLVAGNYRFRVKGCNNAGVWNETGATLGFKVMPFFWQTWWFRLSVFAAFTVSVVGVVRYAAFRRFQQQLQQLKQQAALYRERARIAKDIHDDLGGSLTQIALLGELTHQDIAAPEKAEAHVRKISTTARQVVKALDEIVWAVNPRNDALDHLIDYLGQFTADFLRAPGIRCRLDLPEHPPAKRISAELRHNLYLAVKEALHNVVKHAQATEVQLRVNVANGRLQIVVEDNGRGFEPPSENAGADGLRNMRQRLTEIGGECRIESHVGAGTKITLELPWPRS